MTISLKSILSHLATHDSVIALRGLMWYWWQRFGPLDYVVLMTIVAVIGYCTMFGNASRVYSASTRFRK